MNAKVEAQLQGIGTLCKILGATGGAALHSERIVFRIGQVAAPERDHHRTEVVVGMSTQQGVELLREGVGLIPPGLALSVDVGTQRKLTDVVIGHHAERMLGNEGDIIVLIVKLRNGTN